MKKNKTLLIKSKVNIFEKISISVIMGGALGLGFGVAMGLSNLNVASTNENPIIPEVSEIKEIVESQYDPTLVLYQRFNGEVSGIADQQSIIDNSNYGHSGKAYGGLWVSGKEGSALELDGQNDYIQTGQRTSLTISNSFSTPEVSIQQGVATNGDKIFVSSSNKIYRYDSLGNFELVSTEIPMHTGGITYYAKHIYATVSDCLPGSTSSEQWVYRFDENLQKIDEFNIATEFEICAGGIMQLGDNFYVAESYYDNLHNDKIVKYDFSFNHIETYELNHQCPSGIQGLDYIASESMVQVNCHDTEFYRINTNFDENSIQIGTGPYDLQDLAYLNHEESIYNNRNSNTIDFVTNPMSQTFNSLIDDEYTAEAWFKVTGGENTRRFIMESSDSWALSIEISPNNNLKYSIQTDINSEIQETDIQPTLNNWHHVVVVYKENEYSKIYYDGAELKLYQGQPNGNLLSVGTLNIGTYRNADDRWFYGVIDEIRLWNKALPSHKIMESYNCWNSYSTEVCTDNIDNDCDMLIDCQDDDCPRTCGVCGNNCPNGYNCVAGQCCIGVTCIDDKPIEDI